MDTQRPRTEQTTEGAEKAAGARALDVRWIHGSPSAKHNTDPDIQVHAHDAHTVILRQNMAVDYEAPFLFLLFGETRAVLIDTGATASADWFPLRRVVDELMETRLTTRPREGYELLVLHTHPHGDHVAGDGQFAAVPAPRSSTRPSTRPGRSSASTATPKESPASISGTGSWNAWPRRATTRPR